MKQTTSDYIYIYYFISNKSDIKHLLHAKLLLYMYNNECESGVSAHDANILK